MISSDKIYISKSKIRGAGRGVFAKIAIKKGEIIEECPVVEIPPDDARQINTSMLVTYIYYLGKNKNRATLALGYGSIYNHSKEPNAKYKEIFKDRVVSFIAVKDIKKDEEITVNYVQGKNKNMSPLWFESQ